MIDGEGGEVTGGEVNGGAAATELVVETGGDGAPPDWMGGLPDEMKTDATLRRYADVPALAKAHIEARKVAKSKVIVPGADADEAALGAFFDAIGRPASPDDYDISMPVLSVDATDAQRTALAEEYQPFRQLAHEIGLRPEQAKALSDFEIGRQNAYYAKGDAEIADLKVKMGNDYAPKLAAGQKVWAKIAGEGAEAMLTADAFERKVGSASLVKAIMRLGEIGGEHGLIEDDNVEGFGEVQNAEAHLGELMKDKTWREKLNAGDVTVKRQEERLMALAKRQALRGGASTAL